MIAPHGGRRIRAGDILVLEADVDALAEALSVFGIKLEEQVSSSEEKDKKEGTPAREPSQAARTDGGREGKAEESPKRDEDIVLRELAVLPGSTIVGRSASDLRLRTRYGLNLLAVSREGHPPKARLRTLKLNSGDLLLMEGPAEVMTDFISDTGCVPLGERELRIPDKRMAIIAGAIMLGSVGIVTLGLLPAPVAFTLGVIVSMLLRTVPPRQVYTAIDWPVIVLLAALIPVAGAMQVTGAADVLARFLVETVAQGNAVAALAVVLVTTMFLSDVMNNAATAAVLLPHCYRNRRRPRRQSRQLPHGGGDWRLLRLPHPHRSPEQHPDPRPRRLRLWRLLETRAAARSAGGGGQHSAAANRMATLRRRYPRRGPTRQRSRCSFSSQPSIA